MADLDLTNFTTVFNDDFTKDKSLDKSLWNASWGNANQFSFSGANGLLLSGSQATGWNSVGIEQAPSGKSAGEGYGLFQFTGRAALAGQGVGICFVMWRADNVWLDKAHPGLLTELDLLESWDASVTAQATNHYYNNAAKPNGELIHTVTGLNLTQFHTYSMDWEAGSLTYYVDGKEIYQTVGAVVPKDYAHGGVNYTMGAEVTNEASKVTTSTVGLYVKNMSYSTSGGGTAPAAPLPPVVVPPTITLGALGTLQAARFGGSVTVTEKIATTGLKTLYAEVLTRDGVVETGYKAVSMDASGNASFTAVLAHSGDYIQAVDSLTAGTVTGHSTAVIITDPAPMMLISSLVEDKGRLLLAADKETGINATMREFMDGKYLGTLRDGLADGVLSMHLADVTQGAHVLKLTLDGSSTTSVYDFTKLSGGSIMHSATAATPLPVSAAPLLVPAPHGQLQA